MKLLGFENIRLIILFSSSSVLLRTEKQMKTDTFLLRSCSKNLPQLFLKISRRVFQSSATELSKITSDICNRCMYETFEPRHANCTLKC